MGFIAEDSMGKSLLDTIKAHGSLKNNEPKIEYCKKLHDGANTHVGMLAYVVKLADIKDHLSQIDTLTPQLKEKYLSGLRYLL